VRDRYEDIRRQGGEVLIVSFSPPAFLTMYLREQPLPFALVSDPSLRAYRAFGLERTTWRALLRPTVVVRFLRFLGRGWRLKRPRKGEDVLQLGGDFVVDAQRRLVYAHRGSDPTDRPPVADLLRALELPLR
jgi:hypothetical protein